MTGRDRDTDSSWIQQAEVNYGPARFWITLGALALIGILFVTGLHLYWLLNRTTTSEVDQLITQKLQPGASTEEIFAFLDSEEIEHSPVTTAGWNTILTDAGYPPDTKVIAAVVRNTSRTILSTGSIQIFFILDDQGRLREHYLKELFDSL